MIYNRHLAGRIAFDTKTIQYHPEEIIELIDKVVSAYLRENPTGDTAGLLYLKNILSEGQHTGSKKRCEINALSQQNDAKREVSDEEAKILAQLEGII